MLKIKTAPLAASAPAALGALGAVGAGALLILAPRADLSLLAGVSPVILVHIGAALGALGVGAVLMLRPKGRALHRALGWTWVALMGATAASSLFIRGLNGDAMSWIHLLSGWTLVALPAGVVFARRHKVVLHRRTMAGIYLGGLLIAGAFTFVPGRLMWRLFFG